MNLRPTRISETALYVEDLDRAARFYTALFELPVLRRDERLCALRVTRGQVLLLFVRGGSVRPTPLPGGVVPSHDGSGPLHLCLEVRAADLPAWELRLRSLGVPVESRVEWPGGALSLYFRDPDGHALELATPGIWDSRPSPGHPPAASGPAELVWTDALDAVDWTELSALYRAAPLGEKRPQDLRTAFGNSLFRCLVYDGPKLVAAGRALADGIDCAYLCDVAVLPSHQGRGLGTRLIRRLMALSSGHRKIILYAAPGKEPLYHRLGFRRMTTAMAIFEDPAAAAERGLIEE